MYKQETAPNIIMHKYKFGSYNKYICISNLDLKQLPSTVKHIFKICYHNIFYFVKSTL